MTFTDELRQKADPIWKASFDHPFVQGLGDSTLPLDRFRYYVLQDAYYLSHFAKMQALAAAKADLLEVTNRMAKHVQGTYEAELNLHRTFMKQLNISEKDQQSFEPAPTAYAYTSHMYRASQFGQLGDVIAAILPCYWLYAEIGEQLKDKTPKEPVYQTWIQAYHSDWFMTLVKEQIDRLDQLAETASETEKERWTDLFLKSSQYEYLFWEMAYTLEKWPMEAYRQVPVTN